MNKNYAVAGAILLSLNVFRTGKNKGRFCKELLRNPEVNIFGKEKNEGPIHKIDTQLIQDFNKTNVVDAVNLLRGVISVRKWMQETRKYFG
jgi:iron complex outermembrane receptor protein